MLLDGMPDAAQSYPSAGAMDAVNGGCPVAASIEPEC